MADQSKKSRSGKHRRTSVGEFRTRTRRLSVETIEGRLLLSVAPLTISDLAHSIFLAPIATPTSGENTSGNVPATPPLSDLGGFINLTGPTTIQVRGTVLVSVISSTQADVIELQANYEAFSSHGLSYNISSSAVLSNINPAFITIELIGDEGGPIGLAPMNRSLGQSPVGQESFRVSADRNSNVGRPESSMLASANISKLNGEWARPTISEVAGGEPVAVEKHRSKPTENDVLPTILPRLNVKPSSTKQATGGDSVNTDSAQSREIPANVVKKQTLQECDRLVDDVLTADHSWTIAPKEFTSFTQPSGIFTPDSLQIDSILDDQTADRHHAPLILKLTPDDRPQKAAALKHTSLINILRSSLSYEPVLVALLIDYVAARYYQHENEKRASFASEPGRSH